MMTKKSIIIAGLVIIPFSVVAALALGLVYAGSTAVESEQGIVDKFSGAVIVDVRDEACYDDGHIPGAINIPLKELGYKLYTLDKTKDIIVYCTTGRKSNVARQILLNAGFKDVYTLEGGIEAWDNPIETSDGRVSI